ncbi:MAG: PHB depolymerase family esterase, partial [Pseudomonadota bacterium]|nr:PHB depolymerase family esterase [Pseudomonadota bacterium]
QDNLVFKTAQATVRPRGGAPLRTSAVRHLVADDFQQRIYQDAATGRSLRYNLFVPAGQGDQPLPLVLFMHDAGATSEFHTATLLQGNGATVWASPQEQAKRPCFVLAPQYDEIIVDDQSRASDMLGITVRLLQSLQQQYRIDARRLYATGQSGGCMMAMAMNIQHPDLFAASYFVAGKWSADLVAPLARKKLWFMASVDDKGAFPSMNAITEKLAQQGAQVSRAWWDAQWSESEYRYAAADLLARGAPIQYTAYAKGTVFTEGESQAGASGHRNTWKYAYGIEPVREWLFQQVKDSTH